MLSNYSVKKIQITNYQTEICVEMICDDIIYIQKKNKKK